MLRSILVLFLVLASPLAAIEWTSFEGPARGFPVLRDQSGKKIADGDFTQWIEGGRLHVQISYAGSAQRITETAIFRQKPELIQDAWSLREERNGKLQRQFEVDFRTGKGSATKLEDGETKKWSEDIKVVPGRAFAGFGFTLAIKA